MRKTTPFRLVDLKTLVPSARNARVHSPEQIEQLTASIQRFGFLSAVVVRGDQIIAGHGRVLAAKTIGLTQVPCIDASDLSEEECRAYALADNRIPENAAWDSDLLRMELGDLAGSIDMAAFGFDGADLGTLLPESPRGAASLVEVDLGKVNDIFWMSIKGPLRRQAAAVEMIQRVMREIPEIEIELGTVKIDGEMGF